MKLLPFQLLNIGDRFCKFDAGSVAVYIKIDRQYDVQCDSGMPASNAHSELAGATAIRLEEPVLLLSDEDVVKAKKREKAVMVGQEMADHVIFSEHGDMFVRVSIIKPARTSIELDRVFQ